MTPSEFLDLAILPAFEFALEEPRKNSPEAAALLLTIALQESALRHRRQIKGPARSMYQYELAGIKGVQRHPASRKSAARLLELFCYDHDPLTTLAAVEHNDVYASALARELLWRLPRALPGEFDVEEAWSQYIEAWRPGRPRKKKWEANYRRAWQCVNELLSQQYWSPA